MTKSTKSHLRGFSPPVSATPTNALRALVHSPLLKIFFRVHEFVARAMRGECVRHRIKQKLVVSRSPQLHTTTRANIAHEEAEQIRARIACTPAESAWRGLTHMRSMCVGVAETGHRG